MFSGMALAAECRAQAIGMIIVCETHSSTHRDLGNLDRYRAWMSDLVVNPSPSLVPPVRQPSFPSAQEGWSLS